MNKKENIPKSISLHLYIVCIAAIGLTFLCAVVSVYLYKEAKEEAIARSEHVVGDLADGIAQQLAGMYESAERTVDVLANHSIGQQKNLAERWRSVESLRVLADITPFLNSVFLGYEDGSYMLLRRLDPISRSKLHPPPDAEYNLQSIPSPIEKTSYFLNQDLSVVKKLDYPNHGFDTRTRDWYKAGLHATQSAVRVGPFTSNTTQEWAVAFSRKSKTGPAVVATLITFNSLATRLVNNLPTKSSELGLMDQKGDLFAYHDWSQLFTESSNGVVRPVKASELKSSVLNETLKQGPSALFKEKRYITDRNGDTWLSITVPIQIAKGDPTWFVAASPLDELLVGAHQIRKRIFFAAGLILLFALAACYFLARRGAQAINRVSEYADKIQHFDFSVPPPKNSPISEIQRLTDALQELQLTVKRSMKVSNSLAYENNLNGLLHLVLQESKHAVGAVSAVAYVKSPDARTMQAQAMWDKEIGEVAIDEVQDIAANALQSIFSIGELNFEPQMLLLSPPYSVDGASFAYVERYAMGKQARLLLLPLTNQEQELIGMVSLVLPLSANPSKAEIAFVSAFCGAAAVAIEHQRKGV